MTRPMSPQPAVSPTDAEVETYAREMHSGEGFDHSWEECSDEWREVFRSLARKWLQCENEQP